MGDESGSSSTHQAMTTKCHTCHKEAPFSNLHKGDLWASTAPARTHDCSESQEMGSWLLERVLSVLAEPSPPGPPAQTSRAPESKPSLCLPPPCTARSSVSPTSL